MLIYLCMLCLSPSPLSLFPLPLPHPTPPSFPFISPSIGDKSLLDLRQIYFEIKETVFEKAKLGYVCDSQAFEEILKRYLTPDKRMGDVRHPK